MLILTCKFDLDGCAKRNCSCYGDCLDEASPVIPLPAFRSDAPLKIMDAWHGRERYRHRIQHERMRHAAA